MISVICARTLYLCNTPQVAKPKLYYIIFYEEKPMNHKNIFVNYSDHDNENRTKNTGQKQKTCI